MGRRKDRDDMRLNAEEELQNAWLTGSCPWNRNTWRGVCLWGGEATYLRKEGVRHPRKGRVAEGETETFAVVRQLLVRLQLLLSNVGRGCHMEDIGRLRGVHTSGLGAASKGHGKTLWSQAQVPCSAGSIPRGQGFQ